MPPTFLTPRPSAWTPLPSALEAILEPMRPTALLATLVPNLPATLEPIVPSPLPRPGMRPVTPPISIAVPRPSFHFLPEARLVTIWPAPALIAPITAPAITSTARPEPKVAITNAVSAMATIRLTQKPGSVSSLATNSNAALSFSATHLAAETILPHRPPGFLGSLVASALTFAWPWETLPALSPGIFAVPPWTLASWSPISPLVLFRPSESLPLTLSLEDLTLPV